MPVRWTARRGDNKAGLSSLSDVGSATPTNRNVLVADGTDWESRALVEADISDLGSYGSISGTETITGAWSFNNDLTILGGNTLIVQDSANTDSLTLSNDGSHSLYVNNTAGHYHKFDGASTDQRIYLRHGSADRMYLRASASTIELRGLIDSANLQLYARNSASSDTLCFQGDPDGNATIYYAGSNRIQAIQDGARFVRPLYILEGSAARADQSTYGQIWVKNTTPQELWFTDEAGLDTQIV